MGNKHAHVEKAQRNEAALSRFNFEPDLYEWYITVSFYASVHWLRAFLTVGGRGLREEIPYEQFPHQVREVYRAHFGQNAQAAETALNAFQIIKKLSQRARYGCESPAWYARQTGTADAALKTVRDFVTGHGVEP